MSQVVMTAEKLERAKALRAGGWTYAQISVELGMSRKTVSRWCTGKYTHLRLETIEWTDQLREGLWRSVADCEGVENFAKQSGVSPRRIRTLLMGEYMQRGKRRPVERITVRLLERLGRVWVCEACGERLVTPARLCGFCEEELRLKAKAA